MAKRIETIWKIEPHTQAKHALLIGYFNAWLPIMARRNPRLLIVDGFAGPGRYAGGEPGSPLLLLNAFVAHRDRANWSDTEFVFAFIEQDQRRFENLERELAAIELPPNVSLIRRHGDFDTEMTDLLAGIPAGHRLAPSFVFIDPFGWTGHRLELSGTILGFPKCEVLIYVPLPWIARFVTDDKVSGSLDNLFGDDKWRAARAIDDGPGRVTFLHDLFLAKLRATGAFARSFEMNIGPGGWNGYHLFFATGHPIGLDRMKYAMWKLDPIGGERFADSTSVGQLVIFEDAPDLGVLRAVLQNRFAGRPVSVDEVEKFVLMDTPFHPAIHLKKGVLIPAEVDGLLTATNRQRAKTYPPGTILRFKPRAARASA